MQHERLLFASILEAAHPEQQSESGLSVYATTVHLLPLLPAAAAAAQIPFFVDDPLYVNGSQYYADLINATGAWNLATGECTVSLDCPMQQAPRGTRHEEEGLRSGC